MQSINMQHNSHIYSITGPQLATEMPFVDRVTKTVPESHCTIDIAQPPLQNSLESPSCFYTESHFRLHLHERMPIHHKYNTQHQNCAFENIFWHPELEGGGSFFCSMKCSPLKDQQVPARIVLMLIWRLPCTHNSEPAVLSLRALTVITTVTANRLLSQNCVYSQCNFGAVVTYTDCM